VDLLSDNYYFTIRGTKIATLANLHHYLNYFKPKIKPLGPKELAHDLLSIGLISNQTYFLNQITPNLMYKKPLYAVNFQPYIYIIN